MSLRLWSRTEHRTTVRGVEASAAGQRLRLSHFQAMTLEPGGKPEEQWPRFEAPDGQALKAGLGETVIVALLLTRGRKRKLKLPIAHS